MAKVLKSIVSRNILRSNTFPSSRIISRALSNEAERSDKTTHFGFTTVKEEEKQEKVYDVFENVATRYDLMNDAMSAGVHRLWKDHFIRRLNPTPQTKLVDVAGGTGDIAFRFQQYIQAPVTHIADTTPSIIDPETTEDVDIKDSSESLITVVDINQAMLDVGKQKALNKGFTHGMRWIQGNAENLPLESDSFDAYTIAFGIRNCTHVDKVLQDAYRVLKPGGRFMCLEFSEVTNSALRSVYDLYSFQVIPVMGQILAGDWKSYQYLVESIRKFPNQEEFKEMIEDAGFRFATFENLTFGVAAIHSGFKL
ncbi:2-methoxy-6-polyprenyl-1,4-benzoquinol methylase, mitochondrial-like [Tubulanus polymorphus]|uniref:2-methoxy-6-polyprenyl-1,4-benzoquinol methylase, mitochondrial-like n=1 Tax=Tubulanus polymorphus TaxID=672921 RepID=UPI003DA48A80